jgi:CRP-like cAMP-binding protein
MSEGVLGMLQRHPFLKDFEAHDVEKLATLATRVRFDRDQVIFREGDESTDFYLIVSGLVSLEIAAPDHTFRVQTVSAGDELGWSAVLMGSGKLFQARALERTEALAFDAADLIAACKSEPRFGFLFMHHLLGVVAGRLQATRLQLLDMHSPKAARAGT